jgi:hypothetical protein
VSRGKPVNRYLWLAEPLADNPTFVDRPMFGGRAIYFDGRMVLYLAAKREPWRGVLVTCERDHHTSILAEFPALRPHKILPKWLYLPESADTFERDAQAIVQCIKRLDPRFGIVPLAKKRKRAAKRKR